VWFILKECEWPFFARISLQHLLVGICELLEKAFGRRGYISENKLRILIGCRFPPNDAILRVLLAQWAEIAIEDGSSGETTARFSLKFQNEKSAGFSEYLKIGTERVAVQSQELEVDPELMIDLHGLSRVSNYVRLSKLFGL
jgi:hypothetical protein